MPSNYQNLQMGPCYANFGGLHLGLTKGGVEVKIATDVGDIVADQFGDTLISQNIKGRSVSVTVPMAERDLAKLSAVIPGAKLNSSAGKLAFLSAAGTSLRSQAGALTLHPSGVPFADKTLDFIVPLCSAKGDMSFAYKVDDQRVYNVEFSGYVALESDQLFIIGSTDDGTQPVTPPSIAFSPAVSSAEGNAGSTAYGYTLTLTRNDNLGNLPFTWAVTGGTANAADFGGAFPSGAGVFNAGETTKQITVLVAGDSVAEPDEDFILSATLTGFNTVTVGGTIVNDDVLAGTNFTQALNSMFVAAIAA